jgi:serine/threonine-protein kinase
LPVSGELVDTFLIEEAIGVGGMGAVFRALDTKLDRQVALKLLPPDQANDSEIVPRFYQEGRSAAQLDHENIARVYSIGHDGPYHFIAFEYIEGVTVRHKVETAGALSVSEAVNITLQIASALVHAAMRGVVHRDIKPSNIIITPTGKAKLVDMGLARRFERGGDHGLTQSGMTLGTFDYISPEQARDPRDVDVRSDLYSLGCTLFHMMTGRPPFPGGTVLQKLIQHQEESPADVRTLNPSVPVDLAAVIARLMAKDRDRRYQTPEHLVRDLLGVAAKVGLPTSLAPLPSWGEEAPRPSWEPHLVWLVPVFGFLLLVLGLTWWGREPTGPPVERLRSATPIITIPSKLANESKRPEPTVAESAFPKNISVSSTSDDLLEVLASAPRRSVIVLADDGPYLLGGRKWMARPPVAIANPDLVIKAEPGVRPLVKFAELPGQSERSLSSLLHFSGGHVTIDGVRFDLDVVLPEELVTAIRADDTELTVRGCTFRRTQSREGRNVAAIQARTLHAPATAGDRPPAIAVETCHFDGGQTAILTSGPVDLVVRDCTLGPGQPSIWFDNARAGAPVLSELRLIHSSVMAGSSPVVRSDGTLARVWVDDSVIAAVGRTPGTLVTVDNSRNLTWRGRANLYSGIGVYLAYSGKDDRQEPTVDFAQWRETPTELREAGSNVRPPSVWETAEPGAAVLTEAENPTRVFLLSPAIASLSDVGARRGPFGSILTTSRPARRARAEEPASSPPIEVVGDSGARQKLGGDDSGDLKVSTTEPMPVTPTPTAGSDTASVTENLTPMPLRTSTPGTEGYQPATDNTAAPPPVVAAAGGSSATDRASALPDTAESVRLSRDRRAAFEDEDTIRSPEQFLTMLSRLGRQGGTLRIAAGADLDLPAIQLEGSGKIQITAATSGRRPRLRFRPAVDLQRSPAEWNLMFNIRSGSLQLQGIDLVINEQEIARADRLGAIGLLPGTELSMTDCTITLAANRPSASLFVAQSVAAGARNNATVDNPSSPSAVVRIRDSLLRSGGEAVTVAPGRKIDVQLANTLVSTEASFLRAFGEARSGRADSPTVKIRLEQVMVMSRGGLVHLDGTKNPDEPLLPFAAVEVENSVLSSGNRDVPLCRLDGVDQADDFIDKIHWAARKVAYDRIQTYRRDEVHQTGVSPKIYNRANWSTAFLPTDESAIIGDVKFLKEMDGAQAAWKIDRDDFKLAPRGPLADAGPDLGRIPRPPAEGEL